MQDTYQTIAAAAQGEFKDRGSKFLGYAFPVSEEADIEAALQELRKQHNKARHHCYAWRLGLDGQLYRANDDGEPGGTAGKPILGQLNSFEVTNVLVVVVRYFGGTLLGTGGLINAYREAAAQALRNADIIHRVIEEVYEMTFDYSRMNEVMAAVTRLELEIIDRDFTDRGSMQFAVRQNEATGLLRELKALVAGVYLEEVDALEEIPAFSLRHLGQR